MTTESTEPAGGEVSPPAALAAESAPDVATWRAVVDPTHTRDDHGRCTACRAADGGPVWTWPCPSYSVAARSLDAHERGER